MCEMRVYILKSNKYSSLHFQRVLIDVTSFLNIISLVSNLLDILQKDIMKHEVCLNVFLPFYEINLVLWFELSLVPFTICSKKFKAPILLSPLGMRRSRREGEISPSKRGSLVKLGYGSAIKTS